MTQFALCNEDALLKTKSPFSKVSIENDSFLSDVASDVFSGIDTKNIFTIELNGCSFDAICTAAQRDLAEGRKFSETSLFLCIEWLLETCKSLVFWYGCDYDDLDYVYDRESLLGKIEEALIDSSCELYVRYEREV
jgi:hypothetical protein